MIQIDDIASPTAPSFADDAILKDAKELAENIVRSHAAERFDLYQKYVEEIARLYRAATK